MRSAPAALPRALAILLLAAPLSAQEESPIRTLTLAHYLDWEWVSEPSLSPDGRRVAYTRTRVNRMHDRRESAVWIVNADGSGERLFAEGSAPVWSPDGTRLAYAGPGDPRGPQLFVRSVDGGERPVQLTRLKEEPGEPRWSPDGRWIAYTARVEREDGWRVELPGKPDRARWTGEPRVVTSPSYRRDREGFVDEGSDHLFVVSASGGAARRLTDGDWSHGGPQWTPDGREILFSSLREPGAEYRWRESEIYAVDVATGVVRQLTRRQGPDASPLPSPDGRWVAYTGQDWHSDAYRDHAIWVMAADGSDPRPISGDLDRSASLAGWAPDGSGVYVNVRSAGTSNVWFAPLDGRPVQPVTRGSHVLALASLVGGLGVGVRSAPHEPGDVVVVDLEEGRSAPLGEDALRTLTRVNEDVLAGVTLGEVEEIRYRSVDDLEIQGWIVKPPGFDPARRYPLILSIHGGPHNMYSVGFSFAWQEQAANGFVVLYTNPRGSSGYGSEFGNAIKNAFPGKDFDDLMRGVDEVLARGYVDERNLFVYGCSGGGVLTAWIVGHTDRFAAASANCPVTNWLSFVGTTDGMGWYRNFAALPWEDPSEYLRRSPLMYVGNVKTPTLLMTGELDLRTPVSQTEEFYQALQLLRVPTAMVRFRDEWHGTTSRPSNFMRTQLYLREWFQRWQRAPMAAEGS